MQVLVVAALVVFTQSLQVFGETKEEKHIKFDVYDVNDSRHLLDASFGIRSSTIGTGQPDDHISVTFEESYTVNGENGTLNATSDVTTSSTAMQHDSSYFVSEAFHMVTKYTGDMMLIEHVVLAGDNQISHEDPEASVGVYTGTINRRVIDLSLGIKKMEHVITFNEVFSSPSPKSDEYLTRANISFTSAVVGSNNEATTSFGTLAVTATKGDRLIITCRGSQNFYFVSDGQTEPNDLLTTFNTTIEEKNYSHTLGGLPIFGRVIDVETPLTILFWSKAYRTRRDSSGSPTTGYPTAATNTA